MKVEVKAYDAELHYDDIFNMKLKEFDKREVEASSGLTAQEVLKMSVDMYGDYTYVIEYKGKVEGIFGVTPSDHDGIGIGFFLTTDAIQEFWYDVGKYSYDALYIMLDRYERITNFVSVEHKTSVRWLKRLGARFDESTYILNDPDIEFYRFDFCREDYI